MLLRNKRLTDSRRSMPVFFSGASPQPGSRMQLCTVLSRRPGHVRQHGPISAQHMITLDRDFAVALRQRLLCRCRVSG